MIPLEEVFYWRDEVSCRSDPLKIPSSPTDLVLVEILSSGGDVVEWQRHCNLKEVWWSNP